VIRLKKSEVPLGLVKVLTHILVLERSEGATDFEPEQIVDCLAIRLVTLLAPPFGITLTSVFDSMTSFD
jgi:hypothetical protein